MQENYECPWLSQTVAKDMLTMSPKHAWLYHPMLGKVARAHKACFDSGTIIHSMLLEQAMPKKVELLDYPDFRTKEAREKRDAAELAGKMPVLLHVAREFFHRSVLLTQQIEALGFSLKGMIEHAVQWTEKSDANDDVECRSGGLDIWQPDAATIIDIKATGRISVRECLKSIIEFGYDVQRAAYVSAIEHKFPDLAGRVTFLNLFVSLEGDPVVLPFSHSADLRALGESKWRRAVNLWAKCLRENHWPNTIEATPSHWAMSAEFEGITSS